MKWHVNPEKSVDTTENPELRSLPGGGGTRRGGQSEKNPETPLKNPVTLSCYSDFKSLRKICTKL